MPIPDAARSGRRVATPSSTPRRRCSRGSGYHATGIAELCEVNGLGKGAFYHYIGSKEELLAAIHDRVMDEVMLGADRVAEAGGSPSEQLAMLGDELLDVIHRYPDHVWVFLHEFPALTDERAEQFRVRRREYERRVEAVLQAGIDAGEFRDVDPRLTALAWLGMHNYTYLWLKAGRPRVGARRGEAVRRHLPPRDRRASVQDGRDRRRRTRGARRGCRRPWRPRSSAGTPANCSSISSRLPRNVPSACG